MRKFQLSWKDYQEKEETNYFSLFLIVILTISLIGLIIYYTVLLNNFVATFNEIHISRPVSVIKVTELSTEEQIRYIASREQFDNADLLIELAKCESSLNPQAIGDGGDSLGLYQINSRWHKLSDEERFDIEKSTIWTINQIKKGNLRIWSCSNRLGKAV